MWEVAKHGHGLMAMLTAGFRWQPDMCMRDSTRTVTAKPADVAMPSRLSTTSCCSFMIMVESTVKIIMNVPRNSATTCNNNGTSRSHLKKPEKITISYLLLKCLGLVIVPS